MKSSKLAAAVICLFVLFSTIVQAQPKWSIAFNVLQDKAADDYEIYTMDAEGNSQTNVTKNKDVAWTYYSVPGKLLFVSDRESCKRCYQLFESDHDGNAVRKVSELRLEDSWMGSTDKGSKLIVSGRNDKDIRYQLFLIDRKTGEYKQLTNEPKAAFRDPIFSPDGKKIVYVYKKNRTDRTEIEELYIMDADGRNAKRLTTYPANDPMAKEPGYKAGPPHWNKKYDLISYNSGQNGKGSIYAVTPDGKKQWKLTDNTFEEGWHDWSPDGKWLVGDVYDKETGRYDIYLMNYKTKQIKILTSKNQFKYNQAPVFLIK